MGDINLQALTSRRAVLTGLAGGAAAVAAGTLRALPVAAIDGIPVVLGFVNTENTQTTINNGVVDRNALIANAMGSGTGMTGTSISGRGVFGRSTTGVGVRGESISDTGVFGSSVGANAVIGDSAANTASGVYGQNTGGGIGTAGRALTGIGVLGDTNTGIGVLANANDVAGRALHVQGRVTFTTSGLAAVAAGANAATITPGTPIAADSRILCTLESNQAGLSIQRLTKSVAADTFKVYLSAALAATRTAKIVWFVMG